MPPTLSRVLLLAALVFAGTAAANEAVIRKVLEPKLGGAKIEGVQPAPVPGLWEVRVRTDSGVQLLYTDPTVDGLQEGRLLARFARPT